MRKSPGAKNKGYIKNLNTGRVFPFQFNPTSFTTGRTVNYSEMTGAGVSYPTLQYINASSREFSLDLFLHAENNGVYPERFLSSMQLFIPKEDSSQIFATPTVLLVVIGTFIKKCVIVEMEENYDEFKVDLGVKTINLTIKFKVVA